MEDRRLRTWRDWYRFARRELGFGQGEAVVYANIRSVEELNRSRLDRRAA